MPVKIIETPKTFECCCQATCPRRHGVPLRLSEAIADGWRDIRRSSDGNFARHYTGYCPSCVRELGITDTPLSVKVA